MAATGLFTSKVHVSSFHTSIVKIISSDADDTFRTVLRKKVSLAPVGCNFIYCIVNENELYRQISRMIELKIVCNLFS